MAQNSPLGGTRELSLSEKIDLVIGQLPENMQNASTLMDVALGGGVDFFSNLAATAETVGSTLTGTQPITGYEDGEFTYGEPTGITRSDLITGVLGDPDASARYQATKANAAALQPEYPYRQNTKDFGNAVAEKVFGGDTPSPGQEFWRDLATDSSVGQALDYIFAIPALKYGAKALRGGGTPPTPRRTGQTALTREPSTFNVIDDGAAVAGEDLAYARAKAIQAEFVEEAKLGQTAAGRKQRGGDELSRTGQQNAEFFSGKAKEASSAVPYVSQLGTSRYSPETASYQKYTTDNFTGHISKMIPGFAEKQAMVAQGITRALKPGSFLDIGASEGGLAKTVGEHNPGAKVVALDPNPDMRANFDNTPAVANVDYRTEAFREGWDDIPAYKTDEKFDVINEDFTFQFMNNDRAGQIAEAKSMLADDGVLITSGKFHTRNMAANEAKKAKHQDQYFSKAEQSADQQEIISGMDKDMVRDSDYVKLLRENFDNVSEFWNAGNFKGFIASNDRAKVDALLNEIGDLTSEYTDLSGLSGGTALNLSGKQGLPGTTPVTGVHYGNERVSTLEGGKHGTGIKDAAKTRLDNTEDSRTKNRVYFYTNRNGELKHPEAGVGGHVYQQRFDNVLDVTSPEGQALGKGLSTNDFESAVVDAGYDGYNNPDQGMMVILNQDVPANYMGPRHMLAKRGTPYQGLATDAKPHPMDRLNRTDQIYGNTPIESPGTYPEITTLLQDEALEAWGGSPMEYTDANIPKVAKNMADEAYAAIMKDPDTTIGWYKDNLGRAIASATEIFPELATDPQKLTGFKFIKAITSNGLKVKKNAQTTDRLYREFRETGRFPIKGEGDKSGVMAASFQRANDIIDAIGFDGFTEMLNTEYTVKELQEAFGVKVSKENMSTKLMGSAIFGPKIGGGFFQNLNGNFDVATFDRWWQRMWGRHTGTLKARPEQLDTGRQKARTALKGHTPSQRAAIAKKHGYTLTELKDNTAFDAFVGKVERAHARDFKKTRRKKNEFEAAAANHLKRVRGHVEAPSTGAELTYMRRVAKQVQAELAGRGLEVDIADIQAALWYVEKDLYGIMGANPTAEGSDYASAWEDIARTYADR